MAFKPKLGNNIDAALEELEKERREAGILTTVKRPKTAKEKAQERRKLKGLVEPEKAVDRIKILFDDSGSMSGEKIEDAKKGSIEFMRNCVLNQTAIGIYPFNAEAITPDTDLPDVGALVNHLKATGGTPMYTTFKNAMKEEIKATRYIVFTDGSPTDGGNDYTNKNENKERDALVNAAIEAKTPIDTVWIVEFGQWRKEEDKESYEEYKLLKYIADMTGGHFLIFDRNKINFSQAFKYLSPGKRYMLASESFRNDLQEGRIK